MRVSPLRALFVAASCYVLPSGAALAAMPGASPDGLWCEVDPRTFPAAATEIRPKAYRTFALDLDEMKRRLSRAPMQFTSAARSAAEVITLPMPDGSFQRFAVEEAPMMEPALEQKFPDIRTYRAQGLDDPTASSRLDVTVFGFHAQVLSSAGRVFVDPLRRGDTTNHISYFTKDILPAEPFRCLVGDANPGTVPPPSARPAVSPAASGATLRKYRLALACTGEYAIAVCPPNEVTVPNTFAAMTTAMNRVNGVYETEVAITMVFVANEPSIIFLDPKTDGYTDATDDFFLLDFAWLLFEENQAKLDAVILTANYDIGHLFGTFDGGAAMLQVPCASNKAAGVSGSFNPVGDPLYIDIVAHEIGHQFGAYHTFNSCGGNRSRDANSAYEPLSGSTIMAYARNCAAQDLQAHSDPYFHTRSFDQIVAFSTMGGGNACATPIPTQNGAPTVDAGPVHTVPKGTPFTLTGSATDPNGDPMTFCWEEFDLGVADKSSPSDDVDAERPIFRSFKPTMSPSRTFPRLADILSGNATIGESMSTRTRTMTFRLTARDNGAGGGGVDHASTTVNVIGTAGPFRVTAPAAAAVWEGGTTQLVTWNVANTDTAPVSCTNVELSLSADGGSTFSTTLATSTPNNGSASVLVPDGIGTSRARVKAECAGNVFFDISHGDFTVSSSSATCTGDATTLCLSGGRFRVRSTFATPQGQQGAGQAVQLTADTGYFTFFDPGNVELVVKVLNACSFAQKIWVFAGGLTNVATVITVVDTLTSVMKTYTNPQGAPFAPIQDTAAFDTCSAGSVAAESESTAVDQSALAREVLREIEQLAAARNTEAVATPTACVQDSQTLCLSSGRFQARTAWQKPDGTSGTGTAVRLTPDTGYFWFFSDTNIEMVVKVLNACQLNSRYWVFAGGLTNVQVTMTVTDTNNGTVKTYTNPLNTPFQPIQDTEAFATCP